jgi:LuxR family maltose regulon positive regulatory protein
VTPTHTDSVVEGTSARYRAKLAAPPQSAATIVRQGLLDTLASNRTPLILLSAPAGFGKTSLAATWVASTGAPPATWLTVDADDSSGGRFWRAINIALSTAVDEVDELLDSAVCTGGGELALEIAARSARPLLLVLDDFHALRDAAARHQFDIFRRYAPPQLQLMLLTRMDPALPLQRLRMEGALTELRAAELAFTREETGTLLEGIDGIGQREIDDLHKRTEGWPAAVRFAALALRAAPDPRRFATQFAGDDPALAEYLLTEVLAGHPPEVRDFLLRTSIPERLTPDLAKRLAPGVEADRLLVELEKENVFVSETAGGPRGYRYHNLLRGFLRMEAARALGQDVHDLHRVTAAWFAATGDYLPALRHAVAGGDWSLAGKVVLDNWRALLLVESQDVLWAIVADVGSSALGEHAELVLLAAAVMLSRGAVEEADQYMRAAGDASAEQGEVQLDLESLRTLCASVAARLRGDTSTASAFAHDLFSRTPSAKFAAVDLRRQQKTLALHALAAAELDGADLDDAEEHLEQALQLALEEAADSIALRSLSRISLVDAVRGRLQRSEDRAEEALAFVAARTSHDMPQAVSAHNALAWVMYQRNDLQGAAGHASLGLRASDALGDPFERVFATNIAALVDAAADEQGAFRGLRRLRGLAAELEGWNTPRLLQLLFAGSEARLLAAHRGTEAAWRSLEHTSGERTSALAATRARLHLQDGRPWGAVDALAESVSHWPDGQDDPFAVEIWLLEALARSELRDREASTRALEQALHFAAPDRHQRVFLEGGPTVRQLLGEHVRSGTGNRAFLSDLLDVFDNRARRPPMEALLEPLSTREQAVLSYLPTMLSNQEIASELFVSVNTVKTHLRSIYRKLGTSKRRDAVAAARARKLV